MKIVLDDNVLMFDDQVIIDARRKVDERHPKGWVDQGAFEGIGDVWTDLRDAYFDNVNVEETLREIAIQRYGATAEEIDSVEIVGGIPKHWQEQKEGTIKFR